MLSRFTKNQYWLGAFALWSFWLTGAMYTFTGAPGLIQWFRLQSMIYQKQQELTRYEAEIAELEAEALALQTNPTIQEKEIRKTLGYVGENEIVFDFSTSHSPVLRR